MVQKTDEQGTPAYSEGVAAAEGRIRGGPRGGMGNECALCCSELPRPVKDRYDQIRKVGTFESVPFLSA